MYAVFECPFLYCVYPIPTHRKDVELKAVTRNNKNKNNKKNKQQRYTIKKLILKIYLFSQKICLILFFFFTYKIPTYKFYIFFVSFFICLYIEWRNGFWNMKIYLIICYKNNSLFSSIFLFFLYNLFKK